MQFFIDYMSVIASVLLCDGLFLLFFFRGLQNVVLCDSDLYWISSFYSCSIKLYICMATVLGSRNAAYFSD